MSHPQDNKPIPFLLLSDIFRFWEKVNRSNIEGCWIWEGGKFSDGYGTFGITGFGSFKATRISYFLHYKKDPIGYLVCHTCDNPSCCNPQHLFLGNQKQNLDDAKNKGRKNHQGENNIKAKLSEKQVLEIYNSPFETGVLTEIYKVERTVIKNIRRGRSWRHITCDRGI